MNKHLLLPLALFVAAAAAHGETLRYVISGPEGTVASFEINSTPTPSLIGFQNQFFKMKNVAINYTADASLRFADISFYAASVDSGMAIYQELDPVNTAILFDGYGPALYTGSVYAPTMKKGSFDFEDSDYRLVVSEVTAVPEPSTWAFMLAGGLGVAGFATRSRARAAATV